MSKADVTAVPESSASREGTLEVLIALLGREFELGRDEIDTGSHLVDDLDLDSLDFVALAAAIEEEWDCTLEPEDVAKVSTIASLLDLIQEIQEPKAPLEKTLKAPLEGPRAPRGNPSVG